MPKFTIPTDFTDRQRKEKLLDRLITEKLAEISTFAENAKRHRSFHIRTRLAHAPSDIRRPSQPRGRIVFHLKRRFRILIYRNGKREYFLLKKKLKLDRKLKPDGYILFELFGRNYLSRQYPEMSADAISMELANTWRKYSSRRKNVFVQKAAAWRLSLDNYLRDEERESLKEIRSIIQDAERTKLHTLRQQLQYLRKQRAKILEEDALTTWNNGGGWGGDGGWY